MQVQESQPSLKKSGMKYYRRRRICLGVPDDTKKKIEPLKGYPRKAEIEYRRKEKWFTQDQEVTYQRKNGNHLPQILDHTNLTPEQMTELLRVQTKKSRLKFTKKLKFEIAHTLGTENEIRRLGFQIGRNIRNLRELNLSFTNCSELDDDCLTALASNIRTRLKTVSRLSLEIAGCPKVTDEGVTSLITRCGQNLNTLQRLDLKVQLCDRIFSGEFIQDEAQSWNNLKYLRQLNFIFLNCRRATAESIYPPVIAIVKDCPMLSHLNLKFEFCEKLTASPNFLNEMRSHPKCPQQIYISFDGFAENEKPFDGLVIDQKLSLKTIEQLKITLGKIERDAEAIHENTINLIGQFFADVTNLSNLDLLFVAYLSGRDLELLADQIKENLCSLKKFRLVLSSKFITDLGIIALSNQIGRNLFSLSSLCLHFSLADKVSDKGMQTLADQLGYLKDLKSLDLLFRNKENISDKSMKALGAMLQNVRNLESLKLDFSCCDKLTNQGFTSLASQIDNSHQFLEVLNLDFKGQYNKITKDIIPIARKIKERVITLKEFTLDNTLQFDMKYPFEEKPLKEIKK